MFAAGVSIKKFFYIHKVIGFFFFNHRHPICNDQLRSFAFLNIYCRYYETLLLPPIILPRQNRKSSTIMSHKNIFILLLRKRKLKKTLYRRALEGYARAQSGIAQKRRTRNCFSKLVFFLMYLRLFSESFSVYNYLLL